MHLLFRPGERRKGDISQVSRRLPLAGNHGGVANCPTLSGCFAAAYPDRACQRVGGVASAEVLIVPVAKKGFAMPEAVAPASSEIVLLSGHDLRRLLSPQVAIEALRDAHAALADNRGDRGRSIGFTIEGGSIHVKSGLLPLSHLAPLPPRSTLICQRTPSSEVSPRSRALWWSRTPRTAGRWLSWTRLC